MANRIITISRQFGSGGRTIGRNVADKLGIKCYDQELIIKMAEQSGFCHDYIKEGSEYAVPGGWLANAFVARYANGMSNQDRLWIIQTNIIREIAQKESCVIVGRCADAILEKEEYADSLKVFIHANFEKRAERIVKVYGETDVPSEKRLKDKDKRRAAYYQFYTDRKWGDAAHYDVCLDSGTLGIDKCVDIITQLY